MKTTTKIAKFAIEILNNLRIAENSHGDDTGQCPRGKVVCVIFGKGGNLVGMGKNTLPIALGGCSCNTDDADTMVRGSTTCRAIHAEINAVMDCAKNKVAWGDIYYVVTTRAPCKNCLSVLLETPAVFIVCPDNYPDRDDSQEIWQNAGRHWFTLPEGLLK